MKKLPALVALLLVLFTTPGAHARIERLDLETMVKRCDNAVLGEIVARHVFAIDEAGSADRLYFTRLTIEGYSLRDRVPIRVDVHFQGGFIDDEQGVYNSEAPSADDTRIGARAVVFYKWMENMGGGFSGNALYAAHGGLFRTVDGPLGTVALGRGASFAVANNVSTASLETAVSRIRERENR